jgi:hypothetical protein
LVVSGPLQTRLGGRGGMSLLEKLVVTSQSVGAGGGSRADAAPSIRSAAGAIAKPAQRTANLFARM